MIDRVIDFSARNKLVVILLTVVAAAAGWWSMTRVPLDAVPDLSDTQVIVYSRWDQSPDIVEDQLTYPIVSAMLGVPKVKAVRGVSDFGASYVYVVFEDGADVYWARSRAVEALSTVLPRLPAGAQTELGPDATSLGWVFQYVLVDESRTRSLAELRSLQDWYLRYYLRAVPGVAEVAAVGGFTRQYQVRLDPNRLQAYGIPANRVADAVRAGNRDVGGRLIEIGGAEYMVRGRGYVRSVRDLENVAVAASETGTPIRVRDLGHVGIGPDLRRGVADLDGTGDVVSGIVVMRQGENALNVITRVKARLHEIEPGLPHGVKVVPVYDRSELIHRSIDTVRATLVEVVITVSLVIFVFLWHVPSAVIPVITIPLALLVSFVPFSMLGISANIMSLGGLAIAIGALADAAIVVVEQTHKKLEQRRRTGSGDDPRTVVLAAVKEVGGPSFFALLVIAVSFLPILTLEAQEGRVFRPLAYTKSLAIAVAAVLAITLDPALRLLFTQVKTLHFRPRWLCRVTNAVVVGTIHPEERHPVSRALMRVYEPVARWSLRRTGIVMGVACVLIVATVPAFQRLGAEFMPPLDEESLLYMPSTMPGISIAEAERLLQVTDRIIRRFPEVDRVLGKAGRADTATDPAPLSMLETIIVLRPRHEWRGVDTWYTSWAPGWARGVLRRITPDRISVDTLVAEMNAALDIPGVANAWTMPIKARVDMLSTGMRTPLGLKISGGDLATIEQLGARVEAALAGVPGTRAVFAERAAGGYFLDIEWNREALARYGLTIDDAQAVVQGAIAGESVTTTVEGRERYPVSVRYMRDFRSDPGALGRVLVPAAGGQRHVPLTQLATLRTLTGPSMIRNENGLLTGYVYVDVADRDPAGYVSEAGALLRSGVALPPGYALTWSGQYEAMQRSKDRLVLIVPLTLLLMLLLLYANTRSLAKTAIVVLAVPFSAIGAIWFVYLLGYNMSVAVWVGLIALLGVDAQTGVFMLLYLDLAYEQARREGRLRTRADLRDAILHGAVKRLRPKFMTMATTLLGLLPVLWALGTGSDVMKRVAAPMIGGILTSFLMELVVYPPVYQLWKWHREVKKTAAA